MSILNKVYTSRLKLRQTAIGNLILIRLKRLFGS